eukprot:gene1963-7985_t
MENQNTSQDVSVQLDALLAAEAEVAQLQNHLASLDATIEQCGKEIGIQSDTWQDVAHSSSATSQPSVVSSQQCETTQLQFLWSDDPCELHRSILDTEEKLTTLRLKRKHLEEAGEASTSQKSAGSIWSQSHEVIVDCQRRLLQAQEYRVDWIRSQHDAFKRLTKMPVYKKLTRSTYPKWQRPTYDFMRHVVEELINKILHHEVLDMLPDSSHSYDDAITAALHLKISWWLARQLEDEVVTEMCMLVCAELVVLRTYVAHRVDSMISSAIAPAQMDEASSSRLSQVLDAMKTNRSRSLYCIKHSQSLTISRVSDEKDVMQSSKLEHTIENLQTKPAFDQPAVETASKDGVHPIAFRENSAAKQQVPFGKDAIQPFQSGEEMKSWTKDSSKYWRSLLSLSLLVVPSPSYRYKCFLSQNAFAVARFASGMFQEYLSHGVDGSVSFQPIDCSWAQNEQWFALLQDDANISLCFDGIDLIPTGCFLLPYFSLLGDETHVLVLYSNGDVLPLPISETEITLAKTDEEASASVNATTTNADCSHRNPFSILSRLCRAHRQIVLHVFWSLHGVVTVDASGHVCIWEFVEDYLSGFGWIHPKIETRLQLCQSRAWASQPPTTKFFDPKGGSRRAQITEQREKATKYMSSLKLSKTPWSENVKGNQIVRVYKPEEVQEEEHFTCAILTFAKKNNLLTKFQTQQFTQAQVLCKRIIGILHTPCRGKILFATLFDESYQQPHQVVVFAYDIESETLFQVMEVPIAFNAYQSCLEATTYGAGIHILVQKNMELPDVFVHCGNVAFVCQLQQISTSKLLLIESCAYLTNKQERAISIQLPSFIMKRLHELRALAYVEQQTIVVCLYSMIAGRAVVLRHETSDAAQPTRYSNDQEGNDIEKQDGSKPTSLATSTTSIAAREQTMTPLNQ